MKSTHGQRLRPTPSKLPWTVVITLAVIFAAGCGRDWKAEVSSNTTWYMEYGAVSGGMWTISEQQGNGSETINLPDDDRICLRVVQTGRGFVEVEIRDDGGGLFHLAAEDSRKGKTNLPNGQIEICTAGTLEGFF